MFNFKSEAKKESEVEGLKAEIKVLEEKEVEARRETRATKDALASVKNDKKMEEENLKHLIKMREEKQNLEIEQKKVQMEREKFNDIEAIKDDYRKKLEDLLKNQIQDAKESHQKLMEHMPKIEAMFSNQPENKDK